jgi:hypothetical protein
MVEDDDVAADVEEIAGALTLQGRRGRPSAEQCQFQGSRLEARGSRRLEA